MTTTTVINSITDLRGIKMILAGNIKSLLKSSNRPENLVSDGASRINPDQNKLTELV